MLGMTNRQASRHPGVLLVPGWDDDQQAFYRSVAQDIENLGWTCHTLNLPGTSASTERRQSASRADHLRDMLTAYDALAAAPRVDSQAGALIGVSYGGYLAAFVSAMRPVRWLLLRSPALYRDEGWATPKELLDKEDLVQYRQRALKPRHNKALAACARFRGEALLIESALDQIVPHAVSDNYAAALNGARSMQREVIAQADHELSQPEWQQQLRDLLRGWLAQAAASTRGEVFGARTE
ncbi:alpha/beta fold hydrolase [Variovorax sp. dw_954]|uniref:alpha/beta hydrolase family protein n=1 Tax=Variovorax sp. dw_954 TaxID=2720078 RepID=UPI001BD41525|nr:alpha/beta fold hydrolase [Variovorax sp. dw_954]